LPINCVNWYEAYAFCIWDGGFLPTDAELNYASAGGAEQRRYPWSDPPNSDLIDGKRANYCAGDGGRCGLPPLFPGSLPAGDGKWGQSDLAGNLWEWVLDSGSPSLPVPCDDCTTVFPKTNDPRVRQDRGGSLWDDAQYLLASYGQPQSAQKHYDNFGIRCARAP
jgi:formylglycine-generating enzyme required for sulfatase activity